MTRSELRRTGDSLAEVVVERALCPILVGRETELSLLEDALLAANRGDGQVVLLAADAGMGKTRLATELARQAQRIDMEVLWGGCSEADLAMPYLPFLEGIGNYLRKVDVERIRAQLGPDIRELGSLFPRLDPEGPRTDLPDRTQGRLRLFEAVLTLLGIPAGQRGVLLVLEDLHWADPSTREMVDYLSRRLPGTRILILGTYRRDEMHRKHALQPLLQGWRRSGLTTMVDLEALDPDQVARMVGAILDEVPGDEIRDFLHARTEGNPFVIEEMLKAALDGGDIFRTEDGWDRRALSEIQLPESVRDTILMRVERLRPEHAEVLRTAAVIGQNFDYATLAAIADEGEEAVRAALRATVQEQLLVEDSDRLGGYRFRHALTREAIYEDMIGPERERLHSRIADELASQPRRPAVDLSQHLLAAHRWKDAIPVCLEAAEASKSALAYAEAARLYELLLPHIEAPVQRARVQCLAGEALDFNRSPAAAQHFLEAGISALEEAGEVLEAAPFRLLLANCLRGASRSDLAMAEYERVAATLLPEGPSETLAAAYTGIAGELGAALEFERSIEAASRAIEMADLVGAIRPRIMATTALGVAIACLGRVDEGLEHLRDAHRFAIENGLSRVAIEPLANAAFILPWALRLREARAFGERVRTLMGPVRSPAHERLDPLGDLMAGHPVAALKKLESALALAREKEALGSANQCLRSLAEAHRDLDQMEAGRAALARFQPKQEVPLWRAGWLGTRIRLCLDFGQLDEAVALAAGIEQVRAMPLVAGLAADGAVEALIAGKDLAGAESAAALARELGAARPLQARIDGWLALARGEAQKAVGLLTESADSWEGADFIPEACRTRRSLAEALIALGDRAMAAVQLHSVVRVALERGLAFEGRRARQRLVELGIAVDDTPVASASEVVPGGERLVTVLFAQVLRSAGTTPSSVPPEMADRVGTLQRWARQEVERHQGTMVEFGGEAVVAAFDLSGNSIDQSLHAVKAALAIRDKAALGGLPMGIGIATGPVGTGVNAGEDAVRRLDPTTGLAAQLQGESKAGEVLLSLRAYRRVQLWLDGHGINADEERIQLQGFAEPMLVRRLGNGSRDARARPGPALTRRQLEVAALVALGLTNRQIADKLVIAERTAEGHVEQIRNRLGFSSRSQVAAWAAKNSMTAAG